MCVIFVYSRCGHCKALAPEFEQAAAILRFNNPPITLAEVGKMDLLCFWGVTGFSHTPSSTHLPTYLLFGTVLLGWVNWLCVHHCYDSLALLVMLIQWLGEWLTDWLHRSLARSLSPSHPPTCPPTHPRNVFGHLEAN